MMTDAQMIELFRSMKTVAVVGLSSNPLRPSLGVSRFLQRQGYKIIPINPNETSVLGEPAYPSLTEAPDPIDVVNIFRRPAAVPEVVTSAAGRNIRCIWMQEGVFNQEAAEQAEALGMSVMMNTCILKEMARLVR